MTTTTEVKQWVTDCDHCGEIRLCHESHGGTACANCDPEGLWPEALRVALDAAIAEISDDDDHPVNDPCVDNWRVWSFLGVPQAAHR